MRISLIVISKDEPSLAATLASVAREVATCGTDTEVIVVDASSGRLSHIELQNRAVRWIAFVAPPGVRISIPHQRNAGIAAATGDIIVFTDAGCEVDAGWLGALSAPIVSGAESVTAGLTLAAGNAPGLYDADAVERMTTMRYLKEAATINLAFSREVAEQIGAFDESFEYGSDVDFTWRCIDRGYRVRAVPAAVVRHDWGGPARQLKRARQYGRARARLYAKHRHHLRAHGTSDMLMLTYPAFLLFLPLTLVLPIYPLALAIPLWLNRRYKPILTLIDHLAFGIGFLQGTADLITARRGRARSQAAMCGSA